MPSMMKRFSEPDDPSIWMPPLRDSSCAPGANETTEVKSRPFGSRSMSSLWMLANAAFCLVSMSGDSPVTSTVSETPAIESVKVTLRSWPSARSTKAFEGAKPSSVAVTS
jgi:hypothetical protein